MEDHHAWRGTDARDHPGVGDAPAGYLARRPVFDRDLAVVAYEVVAHDAPVEFPFTREPDKLRVVHAALVEQGLPALTGSLVAHLAFPVGLVAREAFRAFDPGRVVVRLDAAAASPDLLTGVVDVARKDGFRFALTGFRPEPEHWSMVSHFATVEIDVRAEFDAEEIGARLAAEGVEVIASGVDSYDRLDRCREAGFERFQGLFFERCAPAGANQTFTPERLAVIRLLGKLHDPETTVDDVTELVRRDVVLSLRVLGLVNSVFYATRQRVESVDRAVVLLGLDGIRNLVSLVALVELSGKPSELASTVLVRARHAELLAPRVGVAPASAFTAGLLSLLDAMLDEPMESVVERVPLAEDLQVALLGRVGPLGRLLAAVEAYEHEDLFALVDSQIELAQLSRAYVDAVVWTMEVRSAISRPLTAPVDET